jgi:hypothetical protein
MSNSSQLFSQKSTAANNVANDMREFIVALVALEFIINSAEGAAASKVRGELSRRHLLNNQWPHDSKLTSKNYSFDEDKLRAKEIVDVIATHGMNDFLQKLLDVYNKLFNVELAETHDFFRRVWKAGDLSALSWVGYRGETMSEQHLLNKILESVPLSFDLFNKLLTRIPGDYRQLFINRYLGSAVMFQFMCEDIDKFKALMTISRNPNIRFNIIESVENDHSAATILQWLVMGLICIDANSHGVERVRNVSSMIDFMVELGADPDLIRLVNHEPVKGVIDTWEKGLPTSARNAAQMMIDKTKQEPEDELNEDIRRSIIETCNKVLNLPRKTQQNDADEAHVPIRRSRSFS